MLTKFSEIATCTYRYRYIHKHAYAHIYTLHMVKKNLRTPFLSEIFRVRVSLYVLLLASVISFSYDEKFGATFAVPNTGRGKDPCYHLRGEPLLGMKSKANGRGP